MTDIRDTIKMLIENHHNDKEIMNGLELDLKDKIKIANEDYDYFKKYLEEKKK